MLCIFTCLYGFRSSKMPLKWVQHLKGKRNAKKASKASKKEQKTKQMKDKKDDINESAASKKRRSRKIISETFGKHRGESRHSRLSVNVEENSEYANGGERTPERGHYSSDDNSYPSQNEPVPSNSPGKAGKFCVTRPSSLISEQLMYAHYSYSHDNVGIENNIDKVPSGKATNDSGMVFHPATETSNSQVVISKNPSLSESKSEAPGGLLNTQIVGDYESSPSVSEPSQDSGDVVNVECRPSMEVISDHDNSVSSHEPKFVSKNESKESFDDDGCSNPNIQNSHSSENRVPTSSTSKDDFKLRTGEENTIRNGISHISQEYGDRRSFHEVRAHWEQKMSVKTYVKPSSNEFKPVSILKRREAEDRRIETCSEDENSENNTVSSMIDSSSDDSSSSTTSSSFSSPSTSHSTSNSDSSTSSTSDSSSTPSISFESSSSDEDSRRLSKEKTKVESIGISRRANRF